MEEANIDPVALEHRLTSIEGQIDSGFSTLTTAVNGVAAEVKAQNGRIGTLEDEDLKDQGGRDVRRRDLAALAVGASILPSIIAGVALFT